MLFRSLMPRIVAFGKDGKLEYNAISHEFMESWQMKNRIGAYIAHISFTESVKCAIFLADSRCATLPKGKKFEDMPNNFADWPEEYIQEGFVLAVNAKGMKGFGLVQTYKSRLGEITFDKPHLLDAEGRFIFNLTNTTEEAAIIEAMSRGREGTVAITA